MLHFYINVIIIDKELCKILEPNVSTAKDNILGLLDYCEEAGVYGIINFGIGVTMREANREYFY